MDPADLDGAMVTEVDPRFRRDAIGLAAVTCQSEGGH